jgi:hypothetical protein
MSKNIKRNSRKLRDHEDQTTHCDPMSFSDEDAEKTPKKRFPGGLKTTSMYPRASSGGDGFERKKKKVSVGFKSSVQFMQETSQVTPSKLDPNELSTEKHH